MVRYFSILLNQIIFIFNDILEVPHRLSNLIVKERASDPISLSCVYYTFHL